MVVPVLPLPLADMLLSFRQSDFQGKAIVIALFVGSIFAWSIMITKMRELRGAREGSRRFIGAYRREAHPAALFLKRQRFDGSPFYTVYEKTMTAVGSVLEARGGAQDELFAGAVGTEKRWLSDVQMSYVRNVAERTVTDEAMLLENTMGLLATAVTTAPFLGLLGTVWGVLDAFGAISLAGGTAMLSAVAPGISGALLTTVVGLLVALPSAIGYNLLTDRIRKIAVEMDHFSQELLTSIERHYREP